MSHFTLTDKVALVTGSASGIGLATARALLARGARVIMADSLATTSGSDASLDERCLALNVDVADRGAMTTGIARAAAHFGGVDLVVANAGIAPTPATLRFAPAEEFARVLTVNVLGVLHTVKPVIEELITNRGHIAVVSSAAAYSPPLGGAAYMVSKAAAEVLARALRLELAPHEVGVTTAAFGFVDTRLASTTLDDHEAGRLLTTMLPPLLRKRISATDAARILLDAVERRSARVTSPQFWAPLGLLRGLVTPALDQVLVHSRRAADVVFLLERDQIADHSTASRNGEGMSV